MLRKRLKRCKKMKNSIQSSHLVVLGHEVEIQIEDNGDLIEKE